MRASINSFKGIILLIISCMKLHLKYFLLITLGMIGNGNDGDAFMKYDQFNFILMLDLTIFLQAYMYEELVSLGNCSSRSI